MSVTLMMKQQFPPHLQSNMAASLKADVTKIYGEGPMFPFLPHHRLYRRFNRSFGAVASRRDVVKDK